jgi:hypothetical protein
MTWLGSHKLERNVLRIELLSQETKGIFLGCLGILRRKKKNISRLEILNVSIHYQQCDPGKCKNAVSGLPSPSKSYILGRAQ